MRQLLPDALEEVIEQLGNLPGVGVRTAERYATHLLRGDDRNVQKLASSLQQLHKKVKHCPVTFAYINDDQDVSPLYSDSDRDKKLIAVVEEPLDIIAIERTNQYKGTYHVLGGAISPIDGIGPEQLHIPELVDRIKSDEVEEIIIATNASVEGESTSLYLQRYVEDQGIKVKMSRLARGLPVGVDLEYADQITLTHALEGRKVI